MAVATLEHRISTVRWVDSGVGSLVSTYAGIDPTDTVQRWDVREKNSLLKFSDYFVLLFIASSWVVWTWQTAW